MKVSSRVLHLIVMGKPEDTLAPKPPNLFEKLHTKDGRKNVKYWFKKQSGKNVRPPRLSLLSSPLVSPPFWPLSLFFLLSLMVYFIVASLCPLNCEIRCAGSLICDFVLYRFETDLAPHLFPAELPL